MRRILSLPLLACLALVLAAPAAPAQAERRLALVIGNGSYRDAPLKNPVNDARDMHAALRRLGFESTLLTDATMQQMETAVREFGMRLRQGGMGLFYYAGHGVQVGGNNYLVPVNAVIQSESDVKYGCLDAGLVLGKMEDAGNGLNVVILDACRNNPFARSFRSAELGLAKMDAPTGSLIAYATAPGKTAADGQGRNGLYTQHLLRNIGTPGLSVEELFKRVRMGVAGDSARQQVPWEASSLIGQFSFAGGQQTASLGPVPQPAAPAPTYAPAPKAPPASPDDLANRFAGRYAVAPGPGKTPGPLVLDFEVKDGQLAATPSGGAHSARPVSVTNIRLQGKTLSFRYNYKLGVFGVASEVYTDFTGELGEDLSAIPFRFATHDGNRRDGWLVRLPGHALSPPPPSDPQPAHQAAVASAPLPVGPAGPEHFLNTSWRSDRSGGNPNLAFVRFEAGGRMAYSYSSPEAAKHDGTDFWRVEGGRLIITWTNGYATETHDVSRIGDRYQGHHTVGGAATLTRIR